MPIKLIAVKLNPSENLHTDGERITIKFNRATSTYQYINTQGAKTTVELWTELAPTNTSFMSKAEFYAAIKSGETFDIIVPKTKMGTGQRVITVEW